MKRFFTTLAMLAMGVVLTQAAELTINTSPYVDPITIDGEDVEGIYGSNVTFNGRITANADGWLRCGSRWDLKGGLSVVNGVNLSFNAKSDGTGKTGGNIVTYGTCGENPGTVTLWKGVLETQSGTWLSNASGTSCGTLIMRGGALKGWAIVGKPHYLNVEVPEGCTAEISNYVNGETNTSFNLNGNITGSGTISRTILNTDKAWSLGLFGDNSGFSGNFNANKTCVTYFSSPTSGSAQATWRLVDVAAVFAAHELANNSVVQFGELSGVGTLSNYGVTGGVANLATFQVGAKGTDAIFNGSILETGKNANAQTAIEKVGAGVWTLNPTGTATLNYTGMTTVSDGRLNVNADLAGGLTVGNHGVFSPGGDGTTSGGAKIDDMTIVGDLVLDGGTLLLEVNATGMDTISANALSVDDGSTIQLAAVDGYEILPLDHFNVLTTTEALPTDVDWNAILAPSSRGQWLFAVSADGKTLGAYNASMIPEPGAFWLLLLGGLWVLRRRS